LNWASPVDSTVQQFNDSTIQRFNDSTIQRFNGRQPKGAYMSTKCTAKTEVYSRVCGFFRPVQQWNKGKKEEFKDRQEYVVEEGRG
jgi:ribonucleoside-triphosphate reductase